MKKERNDELKKLRDFTNDLPAISDEDQKITDIVPCGEIKDKDGSLISVYAVLQEDSTGNKVYKYYDDNKQLIAGRINKDLYPIEEYSKDISPSDLDLSLMTIEQNQEIAEAQEISLAILEEERKKEISLALGIAVEDIEACVEFDDESLSLTKQDVDKKYGEKYDDVKLNMDKLSGKMVQIKADEKVSTNKTIGEAIGVDKDIESFVVVRTKQGTFKFLGVNADGNIEPIENVKYSEQPYEYNLMHHNGDITKEYSDISFRIYGKNNEQSLAINYGEDGRMTVDYLREDKDYNLPPLAAKVKTDSTVPTTLEEHNMIDERNNPNLDDEIEKANADTKDDKEGNTKNIDDNPDNNVMEVDPAYLEKIAHEYKEYEVTLEDVKTAYDQSTGSNLNEKLENTRKILDEEYKDKEEELDPRDPRNNKDPRGQ